MKAEGIMLRWAVLEAKTNRVFLVYDESAKRACDLVRVYLRSETPGPDRKTVLRPVLSATVAGSWEQVGHGPTGDARCEVVGDSTSVVVLVDERKAPGA